MAKKSIVLLKNQEQLLPLSKETKSIAMIGPFIKAVRDNLGFWSMEWPDDSSTIVTQWQGIKDRVSASTKLYYARGCNINDSSKAGFREAIEAAMQAEVVIMSMGEARDMSGEAKQRCDGVAAGGGSALHSMGVARRAAGAVAAGVEGGWGMEGVRLFIGGIECGEVPGMRHDVAKSQC